MMKLMDFRLEVFVDIVQIFIYNDFKEIMLVYQCVGRFGIEIVISIDSFLNNIIKIYILKIIYINLLFWEIYIVYKINFIRFLFQVERD